MPYRQIRFQNLEAKRNYRTDITLPKTWYALIYIITEGLFPGWLERGMVSQSNEVETLRLQYCLSH